MQDIILLKQGEIVLKGLNKKYFEQKLASNAARRIKPFGSFHIYTIQSTTYVEPQSDDCDMDGAFEALKTVFGVIALVFLVKMAGKTEKGRYVLDLFKLKMPVFGEIIRKGAIARSTRTLGTLMQSGVPVLQALDIVRDTSGNAVIAKAYQDIHDAVKEGENMTPSMEASKQFPAMVVSMVDVGEETGSLPDMLTRVANTYDGEVDDAVNAMTSIIEPIMIVFLAGIVGTIVIAMFSPLMGLITQIGG